MLARQQEQDLIQSYSVGPIRSTRPVATDIGLARLKALHCEDRSLYDELSLQKNSTQASLAHLQSPIHVQIADIHSPNPGAHFNYSRFRGESRSGCHVCRCRQPILKEASVWEADCTCVATTGKQRRWRALYDPGSELLRPSLAGSIIEAGPFSTVKNLVCPCAASKDAEC